MNIFPQYSVHHFDKTVFSHQVCILQVTREVFTVQHNKALNLDTGLT